MANPTQLTEEQFRGKTENAIPDVTNSGDIPGTAITLDGQDAEALNSIILTIDAPGGVTLIETSEYNLALIGVDPIQPMGNTYWEYDLGRDPMSPPWTLEIAGPNNSTFKFSKSRVEVAVNEEGVRQQSVPQDV
jgi:hypothetical protein